MGCGASSESDALKKKKAAIADFPTACEKRDDYKFENWDETTQCAGLVFAMPKTAGQIEAVCEWAVKYGAKVRPAGSHHNWSPITVDNVRDKDGKAAVTADLVVEVGFKEHMNKVIDVVPSKTGSDAVCVVQPGITIEELTDKLEKWNDGKNGDIGYGFVNTPGALPLTLGGMVAIGAHGNSVPVDGGAKEGEYGSFSSLVVACKAIVWDAAAKKYAEKPFSSAAGDLAPFMTNFGRCCITEFSIRVEKNYTMRCQSFFDVTKAVLFAPPARNADGSVTNPEGSFAWHIGQTGRLETIAFPFTKRPWVKKWSVCPTKPAESKEVTQCDNYKFSDTYDELTTDLYKTILDQSVSTNQYRRHLVDYFHDEQDYDVDAQAGHHEGEHSIWGAVKSAGSGIKDVMIEGAAVVAAPFLKVTVSLVGSPKHTEYVSYTARQMMIKGFAKSGNQDIWGTSRSTMLYVSTTTIRITANGYAVSTKRANVGFVLHAFDALYEEMLAEYAANDKYPINMPTEIRVCGKNDHHAVSGGKGINPPLDPLSKTPDDEANGFDVVVYFNVLTLPGTPGAAEWYREFEQRLTTQPKAGAGKKDYSEWFTGANAKTAVEWSKGWAYDGTKGAWQDSAFIARTKGFYPRWDDMAGALDKHDPEALYSNKWLSAFLPSSKKPQEKKAKK
jgi:hypothetical protein